MHFSPVSLTNISDAKHASQQVLTTKLPGGRFTQANWRIKAEWSTKLANAQENEQKTHQTDTPGKRLENARKTGKFDTI